MKKYLSKIVIILIILLPKALAQNQLKLSPSIGTFIYNSENSLKIMGAQKYNLNYGFEISYVNESLFSNIQFNYSYSYSGVKKTLEFTRTGADDPTPIGVFYTDVSLSFNTLDVLFKDEFDNNLFYEIGPSFSIVNKSINIEEDNFEDKLVSFNIGLSGALGMIIPLDENTANWFIFGELKIRYLYGLLFDEKGRNLSNYSQHFLALNLLIGIGLNF